MQECQKNTHGTSRNAVNRFIKLTINSNEHELELEYEYLKKHESQIKYEISSIKYCERERK